MKIAATIDAAAAADRRWDALVVGAGPAGARLAALTARAGVRVLLVDRSEFPRAKVCGGCLSARTLSRLHEDGPIAALRRAGGQTLRALRLAGWGNAVELALPGGLSISRRTLDAILVRDALAAGAAFLPGHRARIGAAGSDSREVALHGQGGEVTLRAAVVVDATGLGGALISATSARKRFGRRIGCGATIDGSGASCEPGTIYMAVGKQGYVGVVRLEDGLLNIAAALDGTVVRDKGFAHATSTLLRQAGMAPPVELRRAAWSSTPHLWQGPASRAAVRLLTVGDAAGYVEPFTGEGIGWALRSAELVAPLVARAADRWSDDVAGSWNRIYRRELGRSQLGSRLLARLLRHPLPARAALGVLRRTPALGAPLVRYLHGDHWATAGAA